MLQGNHLFDMRNLDPYIESNELNSVENSILALLQANYRHDRVIDVAWLQSECCHIGFSPKEFSHGFVKLLMRGHLEPRGEFAYALAAAKRREGELDLESVRTMAPGVLSVVPALPPEENMVSEPARAGVLLVDDDDDVRNVVTAMLEISGYRVFSVESGNKAISCFNDHQGCIDLLLSDVIMPAMSGRELYEQLSMFRPGLPTVFISGYSSGILKDLDGEKNVKILLKPLSQGVLVKTIQELLQSCGIKPQLQGMDGREEYAVY